jgi:hypothetical protein
MRPPPRSSRPIRSRTRVTTLAVVAAAEEPTRRGWGEGGGIRAVASAVEERREKRGGGGGEASPTGEDAGPKASPRDADGGLVSPLWAEQAGRACGCRCGGEVGCGGPCGRR